MEKKPGLPPVEKFWIRNPYDNHGSIVVSVPAAVRRALNWHLNAPMVMTLEGDALIVRQVDVIKSTGLSRSELYPRVRKKSWKKGPQEPPRKPGGYPTEPREPDKESS